MSLCPFCFFPHSFCFVLIFLLGNWRCCCRFSTTVYSWCY
jgi:hypothetical protein